MLIRNYSLSKNFLITTKHCLTTDTFTKPIKTTTNINPFHQIQTPKTATRNIITIRLNDQISLVNPFETHRRFGGTLWITSPVSAQFSHSRPIGIRMWNYSRVHTRGQCVHFVCIRHSQVAYLLLSLFELTYLSGVVRNLNFKKALKCAFVYEGL